MIMQSKSKLVISSFILIFTGLALLYFWSGPRAAFDALYAGVEPSLVDSLQSFRQASQPRQLEVGGLTWEYLVIGEGTETILLLHGMAGAYDIWWQQIEALKDQYRLIAVTYPPAQNLATLDTGLMAILAQEEVEVFHIVGTSLGGYVAQYLLTQHPGRIGRVVLANTFPPNDRIARQYRLPGVLLAVAPEWLVLAVFRLSFEQSIYPTSGYDELTLAFLKETTYGRVNQSQLLGRYYCVIEQFAPVETAIPILIVESDNDPLVSLTLREQLQAVYPHAAVHTFSEAGHFPYLNKADEYSRVLAEFLSTP